MPSGQPNPGLSTSDYQLLCASHADQRRESKATRVVSLYDEPERLAGGAQNAV